MLDYLQRDTELLGRMVMAHMVFLLEQEVSLKW